jgi:hypothetical protein
MQRAGLAYCNCGLVAIRDVSKCAAAGFRTCGLQRAVFLNGPTTLFYFSLFLISFYMSCRIGRGNRRGNDLGKGGLLVPDVPRTQIFNFVVSRDLRWIARQYATRTFCESLEAKRNQNGRAHSFGAPRAE